MLDVGLVLFVLAAVIGFYLLHTFKPTSTSQQEEMKNKVKEDDSVDCEDFQQGKGWLEALGWKSDLSFQSFQDHFDTFEEVSEGMKTAGLRSTKLIIGVDFSASNEWQGKRTFSRHCLHKQHPLRYSRIYNPYQRVISILGKTLQPFTEAFSIHVYGFGDSRTQDKAVFPITTNTDIDTPCKDFREVLQRYNDTVKNVVLSGPTSYAPVIRKALEHVQCTNKYHILVIIADGQIHRDIATVTAIVEASEFPLSIIMIGVGDGPWDMMSNFDDHLPVRKFDNFQFVDFHQSLQRARLQHHNPETIFALQALMEIPDQYHSIQQMGYLDKRYSSTPSLSQSFESIISNIAESKKRNRSNSHQQIKKTDLSKHKNETKSVPDDDSKTIIDT